MQRHLYATSLREEIWSGGVCRLRRSERGQALTTFDGGAFTIEGTDDLTRSLGIPLAEGEIDFLSSSTLTPPRLNAAHLVVRRRVIVTDAGMIIRSEDAFEILAAGGVRVVSFGGDDLSAELLNEAAVPHESAPPDAPLLFRRGSASVLFHEAAGHPAEAGEFNQRWPEWLEVRDVPASAHDDAGVATRDCDLLRQSPSTFRRFTWRDAPLARMSSVRVSAKNTTTVVPDRHIEVLAIHEGWYDPLTASVSLEITLAFDVTPAERRRVHPFTLQLPIEAVARSIDCTEVRTATYPGVICSLAGQLLPVRGSAPDILLQVPG